MEQQRYKANGTHSSKFQTYLTASEYFLQQRNFEDCHNYALKAIEIDPNQTAPAQILAIANVLLLSTTINEDPNHYSILNVPLYTQNQQLIKTHFTNVTTLLNPNKNGYPFASEAFGAVLRAWSVLSNPTQKSRFDNGLKNKEKGRNTFWTVCPYCYYVYEFLKDYEDCCLRCQNENCRRVFHGVPIVGPPPPPEVAEKGEYHCFGFSVLDNVTHPFWSPFVATKTNENNVESGIAGEKTNEKNDVDQFIEISDDDEEEDENGGKLKSSGVEKIFVKANGVGGNFKKNRIKMVARSLNKVLGKGIKVNMKEIVYNEGERFEVEGSNDFGLGNLGEKTNENTVEFRNVGEKTNENTIEFHNAGEKTNENTVEFSNVEKKTNKNTVEFGNVGDNNVEFLLGDDDIYVRVQESFDIGTLFF